MRRCAAILPILLLGIIAGASGSAAQDPAAALQARLTRILALRAERPRDGLLTYYESMARADLGERDPALALLRSLTGRRLGLVPGPGLGFDALWEDREFQACRARLAEEEPETLPPSPVALRLPDPGLIPEGIAYDPRSGAFFLGSLARNKIVAVDLRGRTRDFSRTEDDLDPVLGLAVDPRHPWLYAVSTNGFLEAARTARRNAVVRYSLRNRRLDLRLEAPEALQLNDVAIAPDGALYASDSGAGCVFRARKDEARLQRLTPPGALPGANGIAVSPAGAVYVATALGIARVGGATGTIHTLPVPESVAVGGIDGLYWHDGDLLGIQNTTNPGRVVRIHLAGNGTRVAGLTVLQSHHHEAFDEPTTGVVARGALHVIANSQVGRFQNDGTVKDAPTLRPPVILAVPLRRARTGPSTRKSGPPRTPPAPSRAGEADGSGPGRR